MTSPAPAPRVRIAPAPSGFLHVGSVRTALYNWLYARHHGGRFVFRIEDTDKNRATDESVQSMLDAMSWVGLDWDEGLRVDGPYGPYRQSERAALYAAVARRLAEVPGVTYRDYRTTEELEAWRAERRAEGLPPTVKAAAYRPSDEQLASYEEQARPFSLRVRTPDEGSVTIHDLVRGDVTWDWATISDPVVVRSDGSATYPLANTVDDVAQGITLVCRGEDLLPVTPLQHHLYGLLTTDGLVDDALAEVGFPARDDGWTHPTSFAHLSMIVGEDRKPLSKRHGSVAIQEFARTGYLHETLLNYLALLGWSSRDGQERFEIDELIERFSFAQVGKTAAFFDVDKLTAFNGERIRALDPEELARRLVPFLDGTYGERLIATPPSDAEMAMLRGLVPIIQERMQRLDEVQGYAPAFFADEIELDPAAVKKVLRKATAPAALEAARTALAALDDWDADAIEGALRPLADELEIGFGKVAQPIRVAVSGTSVSPPLFESLELIDKDVVLARIDAAIPVARDAQADQG